MQGRAEHGTATAELATIAPFALVLVLLLGWIGSLGVAQVRLVDAAREGARVVARGESESSAVDVVRRLAPENATVRIEESDDGTVRVTVSARTRPPLPFVTTVGSRVLSSTAVAALEEP